MGKAVPLDLNSDRDVDGAGFLFRGQRPEQAIETHCVVKDVDVNGEHVIVGEPDEPVERDAGVGVFGGQDALREFTEPRWVKQWDRRQRQFPI